jgi:uncharacterized membrane-anchored protein
MRTAISILSERDHPLRRALVDELHVRRIPPFAAPLNMTQVVMFTADATQAEVRKHVETLCARFGVAQPVKGRYFSTQLAEIHVVWESHAEFSTYSFVRAGHVKAPFVESVLDDLPLDWVQTLPGQTIRATQVVLLDKSAGPPDMAYLSAYFEMDELVCADVSDGEARIWSNFKVHDDGFGRLLVQDLALKSSADTSRLLQRLQELGNYRNMALLGLSRAQEADVELSALELKLADLTREVAANGGGDDELFQHLSVLSANLARLTAETRYRMSATSAYAQIVGERLSGLQPQRVPGYQSLIDFTERRLLPAVRTCESFTKRLEDLSERASGVSSLIRTRIETTLSQQSTDLLRSMNQRTQMQLRLQQTVEGLSVLAISYYALSILGYVMKPFTHYAPEIDSSKVLGVAAPAIVLAVWYLIRRMRRL